ncbi:MAG: Diguanylate cyclase/phosphodiesterase with sensor(S) [Acidimicrobiales bacterium]|nr:Diguanylate cyclase/phosphodiesterase with sensor(S) [Acidimicrobiales bacterium]
MPVHQRLPGSPAHPHVRLGRGAATPETITLTDAVFDALPDPTAVVASDGLVLRTNKRWETFAAQLCAGKDRAGRGTNQFDCYREAAEAGYDDARAALAGMQSVAAGLRPGYLLVYRAMVAGAVRWYQLQVTPAPPFGIVVSHADITGRVQSEAEARHRAIHDPLTGLLNRAHALDLLDDRLPVVGPRPSTTVLYVDLDGFKAVNDRLGHDVGDRLLHLAARRMEGAVRVGDQVARLGGDEFVVVAMDCHPDEAAAVAARICGVLRAPFAIGGHELALTASIGLAAAGPQHDRPMSLLRDADVAMYAAKAAGGDRWWRFTPDLAMPLTDRPQAVSSDILGAGCGYRSPEPGTSGA